MNRILHITGLLAGTALDQQQGEFLGDLHRSEERLKGLLYDLLKFHTIESGKLELQSAAYDLRALCESTAESFAARARARGLEFNVNLDEKLSPHAHGSADEIRHVLSLLFENSIELTQRGGITLCVAPALTPHHVEFSLTDTGVGLSSDRSVTLTYAGSALDKRLGVDPAGIGLALGLAKRLVDLMGGSLDIKSKPGHGSVFRFTIPLRAPAQARAA
jgi:signal transduction histidine kinase